jgi:hypothetical protein
MAKDSPYAPPNLLSYRRRTALLVVNNSAESGGDDTSPNSPERVLGGNSSFANPNNVKKIH